MGGGPQQKRATYHDLLQVPEHLIAEILEGEIITSPRRASPHARAASALGSCIMGPFDLDGGGGGGPGGWWVLDEPELHLRDDVLVPDLAGWRRERMPILPAVAAFELAPDWVCEVVSPTTVRHDRVRKMTIYARERVEHLWLLDPLAQVLEVYRLEGERWLVASTHQGTDRVHAEPFEVIELDLARLWIPAAPASSDRP